LIYRIPSEVRSSTLLTAEFLIFGVPAHIELRRDPSYSSPPGYSLFQINAANMRKGRESETLFN
jgi:hypothetical protein